MVLVPVIFEIVRIEANAIINFTFTTPDAKWSMGCGVRESLGFSYNAMELGEERISSIEHIEIVGSMLEIRTCASVSEDPLTLTLFASIPSDMRFVEGYCTIGDGTRVLARFGNGVPIQWRNGRFSARLSDQAAGVERATFLVRAAVPGDVVRIRLMPTSPQTVAYWYVGGEHAVTAEHAAVTPSLTIRSPVDGATIPLQSLFVGESEIKLVMAAPEIGGSTEALALVIEINIILIKSGSVNSQEADDKVFLKVDSDADVVVSAQLGTLRPQYLGDDCKSFVLRI